MRRRSRPQARLGQALASAGSPSGATRSRWSGSLIVLALLLIAMFAPLIATQSPDRPGPRTSACGRRAAAHWLGTDELGRDIFTPHPLRRAHHADDRAAGRGHRSARSASLVGTVAGYLGGWVDARADARHRHLPRVPAPDPRARLRRRARARHRQRDHRHRADRLAALRPRRAGRDADHPQCRLHRRRPPAGRLAPRASSCATSCRCASPR